MRLLLVPAFGPGLGSGHLRRCLAVARRWNGEAGLLLEHCQERCGRGARELLEPLAGGEPLAEGLRDYDPGEPWDLVLLDGFRTPASTLERFAGKPVIGLDEGGPARRFFPYLIDTPLGWNRAHPPNLASSAFLELPARRTGWVYPFRRLLLTFGGGDSGDPRRRRVGWRA